MTTALSAIIRYDALNNVSIDNFVGLDGFRFLSFTVITFTLWVFGFRRNGFL
jgi:hypothetical protein